MDSYYKQMVNVSYRPVLQSYAMLAHESRALPMLV